MKRALDVAAIALTALLVTGIRGPVVARPDRAGTGVGPLRHAGRRCRRQPVLSGLPVTRSRHHRHRRDIPAHPTMDAARHSSDRDGGLAGVRHGDAVFERRDPAGLSPACAGADRNHRRAGVATGGRRQELKRDEIRWAEPGPILLCMGLFSRFLCLDTCGAPPKGICTAFGATHPALVYARSKGASRKTGIRQRPKNRCEKPVFAVLAAASRSPRAVLGASVPSNRLMTRGFPI
jgi:hypothetical protein